VDLTTLLLVAFCAFLIAFAKSGTAGTLGPVAILLMVLVIPADEAVGLLLPMLIFADGFAVAAHWKRWDVPSALRLLTGAVVGIVLGTLVISSIGELVLRRIIGVAMLAFVAAFVGLRGVRIRRDRARAFAYAAGAVSGFISTLAHVGGPPIVVYLISIGMGPAPFVATSVAFFAVVNLLKVPGYLWAGLLDGELIRQTAPAWLAIPFGVYLGRRMVDRIDRVTFERLTVVLLTVGGVILLLT
jgi:uncharacterized membrane protein YfcA